jgi:hypothetical protein
MIDSQSWTPAADVNAWCEMLGLVHDEARDAGEVFLAYLAGVALTHAHSLRLKVDSQAKPVVSVNAAESE